MFNYLKETAGAVFTSGNAGTAGMTVAKSLKYGLVLGVGVAIGQKATEGTINGAVWCYKKARGKSDESPKKATA